MAELSPDTNIPNVELRFISTKDNKQHGMTHYFKFANGEVFNKYDKHIDYSPMWRTDNGDCMLRVSVKDVEDAKLTKQTLYNADLTLTKYTDSKVGGKGKCYKAKLSNIAEKAPKSKSKEEVSFLD